MDKLSGFSFPYTTCCVNKGWFERWGSVDAQAVVYKLRKMFVRIEKEHVLQEGCE